MSRATALLGACALAFASCASPPPPAPLPSGPLSASNRTSLV